MAATSAVKHKKSSSNASRDTINTMLQPRNTEPANLSQTNPSCFPVGALELLPQLQSRKTSEMLLRLHWPEDLIYWVYTGEQPTDSHTWLTDFCKSWALLQKLLSLQLFQRKYLFTRLKVFLWRNFVEGLKKPGGSL